MTRDRKKPGVAFWTTVAAVAVLGLLAYPFFYGLWIANVERAPGWIRTAGEPVFSPLRHVWSKNLVPVYSAYLHWCAGISVERQNRDLIEE